MIAARDLWEALDNGDIARAVELLAPDPADWNTHTTADYWDGWMPALAVDTAEWTAWMVGQTNNGLEEW